MTRPVNYEHSDRYRAIDDAASAIVEYLNIYGSVSERNGNVQEFLLCVEHEVADRMLELQRESAYERHLEEKADERGMRY